jgi:tRNA-2-methylthio-N6-dimethylallyladenosine synthase
MKIFFKTYGCQMNIHDSEIMKGLLVRAGHDLVPEIKSADLVIINTCSVREKSQNKVYSLMGRLKKNGYRVGVTGCVAQLEAKKLKDDYGADFVLGTRALSSIVKAVAGEKDLDLEDHLSDLKYSAAIRDQKRHAWVNIITGCDKFCTYCIVPYTRGREISRPMNDILEEVNSLVSSGYTQITFLGQNVDSYGKDLKDGTSLAKLLEAAQSLAGISRLWFLTSYPSDITDELIETIAKHSNISRNFHIPAQSGSDELLKRMNRRYTRENYMELIAKIRSNVEGVTFGGDIIVGFPDESDEDFEETLSLVKTVRYVRLNVAPYSERQGTVASKIYKDDVPYQVKKSRMAKLVSIQHGIEKELNEKIVGDVVEIIVENSTDDHSYGRTIDNRMVFVDEELPEGEIVKAEIVAFKEGKLYGRLSGRKVSTVVK